MIFSTQPVNDIEKARLALSFFHNYSIQFSKYKVKTIDELSEIVGKKSPTIFLESFGFAINTIGMSVSQVEDAMESLADQSQGLVPNQASFFTALSDRISRPTFLDYVGATPRVALDSASDVVKGAADVGNAVIDTGKSLLVIGPLLIVVAIVYIGYRRTKSLAG